MRVPRSRLSALARKYRALAELRRQVLRSEPEVLRLLAREFPGALRELDRLPLELLDARLLAVTEAQLGGSAEPWIGWMVSYHTRMRQALWIQRRLAGLNPLTSQAVQRIAAEVGRELGEPCEVSFVVRVANPPQGRLNHLVFELLEAELGQPREELERVLFLGDI